MSLDFIKNWRGDELVSQVKAEVDTRMRRCGEAMVTAAKQRAPIRTGHLQASIGYTYRQSDQTVQLYADAPYAIFVEFGTYKMIARPFLRPAMEAAAQVWNFSMALAFDTAPALKSAVAQPKNARHRAIMRTNLRFSTHYNRGAGGRAKMHVGRARRGHSSGPYSSQD